MTEPDVRALLDAASTQRTEQLLVQSGALPFARRGKKNVAAPAVVQDGKPVVQDGKPVVKARPPADAKVTIRLEIRRAKALPADGKLTPALFQQSELLAFQTVTVPLTETLIDVLKAASPESLREEVLRTATALTGGLHTGRVERAFAPQLLERRDLNFSLEQLKIFNFRHFKILLPPKRVKRT